MKTSCTLKLEPGPRVPAYRKESTLYTKEEILCLHEGGLLFLTGGSKSGKSTWAENWACDLAKQTQSPLNYIATLRAGQDPENLRRIELHRAQRRGKGFRTLECPGSPDELSLLRDRSEVNLLECLGNLVANAITDANLWQGSEEDRETVFHLTDEIGESILRLARASKQFILVSNDIFSDVISYDEGSIMWREAMARCHHFLLSQDICCAIEVSAGMPLLWKKQIKKEV